MTKFVVDAGAVLHLASEEVEVSGAHKLLAPTLLRSQTLSALHEARGVHKLSRGSNQVDLQEDRISAPRDTANILAVRFKGLDDKTFAQTFAHLS